jgi:hypothetical protein
VNNEHVRIQQAERVFAFDGGGGRECPFGFAEVINCRRRVNAANYVVASVQEAVGFDGAPGEIAALLKAVIDFTETIVVTV